MEEASIFQVINSHSSIYTKQHLQHLQQELLGECFILAKWVEISKLIQTQQTNLIHSFQHSVHLHQDMVHSYML